MLVKHFLYAIAVFGGDDTDECTCIFQCKQHGFGFQKEYGVYCHVGIRFLSVFTLKTSQLVFIRHTCQDGERFFQSFSDGTFNIFIGYIRITMLIEHITETGNDAARRICKRVVKVKEISRIAHCRFLRQSYKLIGIFSLYLFFR